MEGIPPYPLPEKKARYTPGCKSERLEEWKKKQQEELDGADAEYDKCMDTATEMFKCFLRDTPVSSATPGQAVFGIKFASSNKVARLVADDFMDGLAVLNYTFKRSVYGACSDDYHDNTPYTSVTATFKLTDIPDAASKTSSKKR
jgi:hypothetical protein